MISKLRYNRKAFSLVEMLVAAVLLGSAVVTICAVSGRSLTAIKVNRQKEMAWQLLDRQLTLIQYVGIDTFLENGEFSGEFDTEQQFDETYEWFVHVEEGTIDTLYNVNILIAWGPEEKMNSVSASTVMTGSSTMEEQTESDQQEGQE